MIRLIIYNLEGMPVTIKKYQSHIHKPLAIKQSIAIVHGVFCCLSAAYAKQQKITYCNSMKEKAITGGLFKRITGHHETAYISIKLVSGINLPESNL